MSQPSVKINVLDGALGVLPASFGKLLATVGVSSAGPIDTPATFARVRDIVANFGSGPMVEAAAVMIEKYGRPVVVVRTGAATEGSFPADDAVTFEGDGTSVVTVENVATAPFDDLEFALLVTKSGAIGVDGIEFQWSLDGGRTWSPVTALGIAASFTIPESGGVQVDFAAGTLEQGDLATFEGKAPKWNTTQVGTALDALFASAVNWEICHVVGDLEASDVDVIDPKFSGAEARGKYRSWVGSVRMRDAGETKAAYDLALSTAFATQATLHGEICAESARIASSVSGRKHRRPVAFTVAPREQSVEEHINIADVKLGKLAGVSLRDDAGNPEQHDETLNPGLDDARFTVLRTWENRAGIYVNRARIFSPAGSDFELHAHRRVINLAQSVLRPYFIDRLNSPILVSGVTGFILEEEAREIEKGAYAVLRDTLLKKPKASAVQVVLSRTDNLLSTKTLTGEGRVVPLAYVEFISFDLGFLNPSLQVQTV